VVTNLTDGGLSVNQAKRLNR